MLHHHNHASDIGETVCTYNLETSSICTVIEFLEQKLINPIEATIVLSKFDDNGDGSAL